MKTLTLEETELFIWRIDVTRSLIKDLASFKDKDKSGLMSFQTHLLDALPDQSARGSIVRELDAILANVEHGTGGKAEQEQALIRAWLNICNYGHSGRNKASVHKTTSQINKEHLREWIWLNNAWLALLKDRELSKEIPWMIAHNQSAAFRNVNSNIVEQMTASPLELETKKKVIEIMFLNVLPCSPEIRKQVKERMAERIKEIETFLASGGHYHPDKKHRCWQDVVLDTWEFYQHFKQRSAYREQLSRLVTTQPSTANSLAARAYKPSEWHAGTIIGMGAIEGSAMHDANFKETRLQPAFTLLESVMKHDPAFVRNQLEYAECLLDSLPDQDAAKVLKKHIEHEYAKETDNRDGKDRNLTVKGLLAIGRIKRSSASVPEVNHDSEASHNVWAFLSLASIQKDLPSVMLSLPPYVSAQVFRFFEQLLRDVFVNSRNVAAHLDKYVAVFVRHLPAKQSHEAIVKDLEERLGISSRTVNRQVRKDLSVPLRREASASKSREQLYDEWLLVLKSSWNRHDASSKPARDLVAQTLWLSNVCRSLVQKGGSLAVHHSRNLEETLTTIIDRDQNVKQHENVYKTCFIDALGSVEPNFSTSVTLQLREELGPHIAILGDSQDEDEIDEKRTMLIDRLFNVWKVFLRSDFEGKVSRKPTHQERTTLHGEWLINVLFLLLSRGALSSAEVDLAEEVRDSLISAIHTVVIQTKDLGDHLEAFAEVFVNSLPPSSNRAQVLVTLEHKLGLSFRHRQEQAARESNSGASLHNQWLKVLFGAWDLRDSVSVVEEYRPLPRRRVPFQM
ncbi:hypothetical protein ACM66B_004380 [Microbotryomycetes sp. NB124-2]